MTGFVTDAGETGFKPLANYENVNCDWLQSYNSQHCIDIFHLSKLRSDNNWKIFDLLLFALFQKLFTVH